METDFLVIGGGVAGLRAALELEHAKADWHLIEADSKLGGRVQSDQVDGFVLDRGFQVLLTAYPELQSLNIDQALKLGHFESGSRIYQGGRWKEVSDPLRNPRQALPSILSNALSLSDKWKLFQWKKACQKLPLEEWLPSEDLSTKDWLKRNGFSQRAIIHFFTPFFGGILLDHGLEVSAKMAAYAFYYFSKGTAALPKGGIQAFTDFLSRRLPINRIHLNEKVVHLEGQTAKTESGASYKATTLIIAIDGFNLSKIDPTKKPIPFNQAHQVYFKSPVPLCGNRSVLHLVNQPNSPISNICSPSAVQDSYSPDGLHLISVSLKSQNSSEKTLLKDLKALFGDEVDSWEYLQSYSLKRALPEKHLINPYSESFKEEGRTFYVGDWIQFPSLNSALQSGRKCIEKIYLG